MKEFKDEVVPVLNRVLDGLGQAMTYSWDQAGEIAVSYVLYGRITGAISLLATAAVAAILYKIGRSFVTVYVGHKTKNPKEDGSGWVLLALAFYACTAIATYMAYSNAKDLILVWAAPKVWLIQEAARLMK